MKLIVCLDDDLGMAFLGRRLSRDSEVCRDILALTAGRRLLMSPYSARLFEGESADIVSDDGFMEKAGTDDCCFLEKADPAPWESEISGIVIYRWNRRYPSDVKFTIPLEEHGWHLTESREFSGSSHDKITREVYAK